jgi:hypothetical protein
MKRYLSISLLGFACAASLGAQVLRAPLPSLEPGQEVCVDEKAGASAFVPVTDAARQ